MEGFDAYGRRRSSRSTPSGPGSRGGKWHEPEHRAAYHRAWRIAHPEYQERERLRRTRKRALERGEEPARTLDQSAFPRPLPSPSVPCTCLCLCREVVHPIVCGFCRDGIHRE